MARHEFLQHNPDVFAFVHVILADVAFWHHGFRKLNGNWSHQAKIPEFQKSADLRCGIDIEFR